jgi:hypothetical protein
MKRIIFSAFTAFIYMSCGSLAVAIYVLRKVGETPDGWIILACVSLGVVATIKDIRSSLRFPPLTNGNSDALGRIMQLIAEQKTKDEDYDQKP